MAGSYRHVTYTTPTEDQVDEEGQEHPIPIPEYKKVGDLRSPEDMVGMIENLGDAYEAIEELYGMIWALASVSGAREQDGIRKRVAWAQRNYQLGLDLDLNRELKDVVYE